MRRLYLCLGRAVFLLSLYFVFLSLKALGQKPDKSQNPEDEYEIGNVATPTVHRQTSWHSTERGPKFASSPFSQHLVDGAATTTYPGASMLTSPLRSNIPTEPTLEGIFDISCADRSWNSSHVGKAGGYIQSIMSSIPDKTSRLSCPQLNTTRYAVCKDKLTETSKPRYFFALDLYESVDILPQLVGSIVEVMRFLDPELCALSVVEGRSTDGTFEVLAQLRGWMNVIGARYFLSCSDINPSKEGGDRIASLAQLRNQALEPLTSHPDAYDPLTTVVFINDVALCAEDILELIYQREILDADMTCAMDWIHNGDLFYDVWIGRSITGDVFFEIPQSQSWDFASNLFWNEPKTKERLSECQPFQVFSCWNGAVTFTSEPFLQHQVEFRSNSEGECRLGEPVHLAKDFWKLGYRKIAVVPSVNVAYDLQAAISTKERRGFVSTWVATEDSLANQINWRETPPSLIKCAVAWDRPTWEPWDL